MKPLLLIAPVVLTLAAIGCGGGDSKGGGLFVATVAPSNSQSGGTQNSGGGSTGNSGGSTNTQPTPGNGNNSSGGGNSSSGNSGGSNASTSDITALMNNFTKVKSFRATITITGTGATTATMEVVQPDRFHMTASAAGQNFEIIAIGNDNYTKIGNNWTKTTGTGAGRLFDPKQIQDSLKTASADERAVTKGGTDTVEGKKCQIYTNNAGGSTTEMCIADGLPIRVVTKSGNTGSTTIIFKDYNANIDIKAPI